MGSASRSANAGHQPEQMHKSLLIGARARGVEWLRGPRLPRVLILTMHHDPAYFRSAFLAGATGYVVKSVGDVEVLTAIRAIHRGRTFADVTGAPSSVRGFSAHARHLRPAGGRLAAGWRPAGRSC
jgi:DNA-binding NarL/FixJ family response regulator